MRHVICDRLGPEHSPENMEFLTKFATDKQASVRSCETHVAGLLRAFCNRMKSSLEVCS